MSIKSSISNEIERLASVVGARVSPKSLPGRILRRIVAPLRRRPAPAPPPLERLIEEFGAAYPRATFVQVGSNDGVQLDPLRRQVHERQWSGVMVEPMPAIFRRLEDNYGDQPRVRLANVAIATENGMRTMFYIPEAADESQLPVWYQALASFNKDVLLQHRSEIPDIDQLIAETEVRCVTFDMLCSQHGVQSVDLIHTDTEGYDFEIIKMIDIRSLAPKIVLFEHYHMDRDTYEACLAHLRSFGYEDLAVGMDTVCLHPDAINADSVLQLWAHLRASGRTLAFRADELN